MLTEVVGLALLAAVSPTALLVSAVFLGAANPIRTVLIYLAGAIVVTAVMALVVYAALRGSHFYKPHLRDPKYGLRLGLGVLMLAVGCYLLRRGKLRSAKPAGQGQGLISRMIARPGPKEAFIVGILIYTPSLTFVAAVQAVATSRQDLADAVGYLALIVFITLLCIWLPLLLYAFKPDRTTMLLGSFNVWLRARGYVLLSAAVAIGGAVLTLNGILGLTGVVSLFTHTGPVPASGTGPLGALTVLRSHAVLLTCDASPASSSIARHSARRSCRSRSHLRPERPHRPGRGPRSRPR